METSTTVDKSDGIDQTSPEVTASFEDTAELRQIIQETFDVIGALKLERKAINETIKAKYDELEAKGIQRQGAKDALKRYELSENEREARDFSFAFCCNATHSQPQADLFEPADRTTH